MFGERFGVLASPGDDTTTRLVLEIVAAIIFIQASLSFCLLLTGRRLASRGEEGQKSLQLYPEDKKAGTIAAIVIAHPDDEAMFFAPTISHIMSLKKRGLRSKCYILCLSSGDAHGLGAKRKQELVRSARVFGIRPEQVRVVEDPRLPDGMDKRWSPQVVADHLEGFVQDFKINTIVTFDEYGVSGHSNHRDVHAGVAHYVRTMAPSRVLAYGLQSDFFKYVAFLDLPVRIMDASADDELELDHTNTEYGYFSDEEKKRRNDLSKLDEDELADLGRKLIFSEDLYLAHRAMVQHESQYVWYRRLFVAFSVYTYSNTLKVMRPKILSATTKKDQ